MRFLFHDVISTPVVIKKNWPRRINEISRRRQPACRVYFPKHPARYEPVSTYLGPHSRRTHVPLVRHPPSLDIKANRNAPAIRRHRLAWEHQAKWQYTRSDARTWPTLFQRCDSVDDNGPTLRQQCVLAICEMLFVQPITNIEWYNWIIQSNIATSDYKLNN